ncbi:S1 family peptidase [Stackebrandtia nassauensis]|uniref:Peptidase S1 and S6 chymotrypsin/Hap n=1 Tax=Stackebrandtia nassauensis (strain DSM 44728 / CIP 108903 / NRRL B-16338 / NBRC 102104 / LLR-40K-21) TaxID=446470 RepID=D3Q8J5_STANL|nr:S1 family peptidase [Stackebrandtia nassauensis]ADD44437.1 peptidase S1 and S6 chymotrypsin/Hap [Stackebrandtia nassauensis DSM 44728]
MKLARTLTMLAAVVALTAVPTTAVAHEPEARGGVVTAGLPFSTGTTSRCTTGFATEHASLGDGFLAAGHCGSVGDRAYVNNVAVGVVRLRASNGLTWLWVELDDGWTASPALPGGGSITDDRETPIGGSVCRIGSTTGWHCGTVQAKNATVSYPQGTVTGLTRTNVCAEPGDNGGPFVSGSSAQGIALGGSGNCSSGGTTYFYPVRRVFSEAPALSIIGG